MAIMSLSPLDVPNAELPERRPQRRWRDKFRDAQRGMRCGIRGHSSFFVHFFTAALVILGAQSLAGVTFDDDTVAWKDYRVALGEITTVRRRFAVAFGSCSFREPVDDLTQLGLLS